MRAIDFSLGASELSVLKQTTKEVVELLKQGISKLRVDAVVFVGGSVAKGTVAKSDEGRDVDLFVRFDWKYEDLSKYLEKIVRVVQKYGWKVDTLHGSRDYFRVYKDRGLTFEIIPVSRIRRPEQARNVTDLSYFHVTYIRRHLSAAMKREVILAKQFCKAQGFYGAESYIQGFSGYGLECLILCYGRFEKMLRELVKVQERIVLDPGKHYRRKNDVLISLNESRLHSPIVLVDPTWKERNVLAALSHASFHRFQKVARNYLKSKRKESFFVKKSLNIEKLRKKQGEFMHVVLATDRQEGDIAGTKMKKFARFLERELSKYFEVSAFEFVYSLGQRSDVYFVVKSKQEIVRIGPNVKDVKNVTKFKKRNKKTFAKNGLLHARIRIDFTGKEFIERFDRKKIREMGIVKLEVT